MNCNKSAFTLIILFAYGCTALVPITKESSTKVRQQKQSEEPVEKKNITFAHASYYGRGDSLHGKKTASGERFNSNDFTAAHKSFPFGTKLKVTNPENGFFVIVRVNDRGPWVKGRDLDLSYAAAKKIGIIDRGIKKVSVEVVND